MLESAANSDEVSCTHHDGTPLRTVTVLDFDVFTNNIVFDLDAVVVDSALTSTVVDSTLAFATVATLTLTLLRQRRR